MIEQAFFEEFPFFIALAVLSVFSGLAIKLSASALGFTALQEHALILDELAGQILSRKNPLETFTRICIWNIIISSIVISSGAITFGVLPAVWAFLNLGLFFPDLSLFKLYVHPWVEEAANILSVALGIWTGQNLHILLSSLSVFAWLVASIFGLYILSALLETSETHDVLKI